MKRVNLYLAIVAVVGAIFCGGIFAYTHLASIGNSKIVQRLEGDV